VPGVTISDTGLIHIDTTFGLSITSGWYYIEIKVEETYLGTLCGLCGSYNNDPSDDFTKSDNTLTTDTNEFGNSWQVSDPDWK
jgi:hypothetical protein